MQIPEEYRCCVCLAAVQDVLLSGCPHRLCFSCAEEGALSSCPVCRADLPADGEPDRDFATRVRAARLTCECGVDMPVLEAGGHTCEQLRKRKLPEAAPWLGTGHGARRRPPPAQNRSTFACPLCQENNLSRQGLLEHCSKVHAACGQVAAVCPICRSMPWGDPNYVSRDFLSHLQLRHHCDYAVLADFEADEETMLRRALQESLRDAQADEEDALARALAASARDAEDGSVNRARLESNASSMATTSTEGLMGQLMVQQSSESSGDSGSSASEGSARIDNL
mmetsp:Transcript_44421/g.102659  ORF Transcript_44421/g.102659 Transcript_44421/m.102659 type:complete len:282 (+) Transcript_44421:146-991(+)